MERMIAWITSPIILLAALIGFICIFAASLVTVCVALTVSIVCWVCQPIYTFIVENTKRI